MVVTKWYLEDKSVGMVVQFLNGHLGNVGQMWRALQNMLENEFKAKLILSNYQLLTTY
jgi:hypothetical protein